jgi:hypothetical protein
VRWKPDQLDIWCADWARERRKILGLAVDAEGKLMLQPWERLGKLRSTLGQVQQDRVGAGEASGFTQQFPEVYLGLSLDIHLGFTTMCGEWRRVMDAHYVWYEIPPKEKAPLMGFGSDKSGVVRYFDVLRMLKAYLSGYLRLDNSTVMRA